MTQDDLALRIARLRPGPSADCAGRCRTRTGGISETLRARPIQAAWASAGSFAMGAVLPLLVTAISPEAGLIPFVSGTSLLFLALLGG